MADSDATFRQAGPPDFAVPAILNHDLVVFPHDISSDGIGHYDDSLVQLVKILRAQEADAAYLHPSDRRDWIGRKGFTPTELSVIIGIPVAVIGAAIWDGLKAHFRNSSAENITLKIGRISRDADGNGTQEWMEAEGSGEDIAKAIEALRRKVEPPRDSQ